MYIKSLNDPNLLSQNNTSHERCRYSARRPRNNGESSYSPSAMSLQRDNGKFPRFARPRMQTVLRKPCKISATCRTTLRHCSHHTSLPNAAISFSYSRSCSITSPVLCESAGALLIKPSELGGCFTSHVFA